MNFSERSCKKCLISWKSTRNHGFRKNLQLFEETTMFLRFEELYGKKFIKLPHFVKKHENSSIWPKLCNFFEQTIMFWFFDELFSKRLQKVAQFVKKHEKSSIWPKLCNFSNKVACLCISMNFSGKSCKKCLISSKSTKNNPFGQNFQLFEQTTTSLHFHELFSKKLQKVPHSVEKHEKSSIWPKTMQLFRTNYHVFAFRSTFREKVAKSALFRETAGKIIDLVKALQLLEQANVSFSFWWTFKKKVAKSASSREKARKIIDLAKTCNFSNKLRCFCISMNFQGKSCQKCFVSWKSTKNHRFGQNFATFRTNYHVLAFRWSFQQKATKSASFREKARKIVDLAKTRNFSNKLPCFDALVNFSAKSCRKCLVFWENSKNHLLGQNLQLFEQTTMFWHFDELFRKKMQKVARFVKKHEHSSIWPKLATSRRNYHVLAFGWLLQEKVAKRWKKWLISWKMTKNHRFGLNLQLFEETTMFRRFCQLFSKKWVISWKSTKNRHSEVA